MILPLSKVFVYVCHIKSLGRACISLLQRFMVSAHSHMCWLSAAHVGCLFAQPVGLSTCPAGRPKGAMGMTDNPCDRRYFSFRGWNFKRLKVEKEKTCVDYLTKPV